MTSKSFLIAVLLLAAAGTAHAAGEKETTASPETGTAAGTRFEINLTPGPHYSEKRRYLLFSYTVQPQIAVWLESEEGRFIQTLYVTRAVSRQEFRAAPDEGRPEALPIWSHRKEQAIDAVTAATTTEDRIRYGTSPAEELPPGPYRVMLETNRSYDWNEAYTEETSGVNGQPSLLYTAELTVGKGTAAVEFRPIGTGAPGGRHGAVRHSLQGIDTALQLFSRMTVRYIEETP